MNVTLTRVTYRPGQDRRLYRVVADVDGQRVSFRSEAERQWSCYLCGFHRHAECAHTNAVRKALR